MNVFRHAFPVLALTLVAPACGQPEAEPPVAAGRSELVLPSPDGRMMNGTLLSVNSVTLGVVSLRLSTLTSGTNGALYHNARFDPASPTRIITDEGASSDSGLFGASFVAMLDDGSSVSMTIGQVIPPSASNPGFGDIYQHTIYNAWVNVIDNGDGTKPRVVHGRAYPCTGRDPVIMTAGYWDSAGTHHDDPDRLTVSCRNGAISKCITGAGYKPWQSASESYTGSTHSVPLSALLQACTRMMRADYCGDGNSHTSDGTPIDVWDALGIQNQSQVSAGINEWTESGASYIGSPRQADGSQAYVAAHCPGTTWAPGTTSPTSTFSAAGGFSTQIGQRVLLREHLYQ